MLSTDWIWCISSYNYIFHYKTFIVELFCPVINPPPLARCREADVALLRPRSGPGLPQEEQWSGAAPPPGLRLLLRAPGPHGPVQGLPLLRAQPADPAPGALLPPQAGGLDRGPSGDQRGADASGGAASTCSGSSASGGSTRSRCGSPGRVSGLGTWAGLAAATRLRAITFFILVSKYIRINIISHLFWVDIRQGLHSHSWNMRFFVIFVNEMCRKLWGDDIINSLIWLIIRTGQEMFSEKMWNFKMSQLPYFLSDFHNFCTNL